MRQSRSPALTFVLNKQQSELCHLIDWDAEYLSVRRIITRISFTFFWVVIGTWLSLIYSKAAGGAIHAMMFIFPSGEGNKTLTQSYWLLVTRRRESWASLCISASQGVWSLTKRLSTKLNHVYLFIFLHTSWWQCSVAVVLRGGGAATTWYHNPKCTGSRWKLKRTILLINESQLCVQEVDCNLQRRYMTHTSHRICILSAHLWSQNSTLVVIVRCSPVTAASCSGSCRIVTLPLGELLSLPLLNTAPSIEALLGGGGAGEVRISKKTPKTTKRHIIALTLITLSLALSVLQK